MLYCIMSNYSSIQGFIGGAENLDSKKCSKNIWLRNKNKMDVVHWTAFPCSEVLNVLSYSPQSTVAH